MCDQLVGRIREFGAAAIHGDKSQSERDWVLRNFKAGQAPIMVATDVAARGLDIPHVAGVINFDFPNGVEDYIHRIGRTGRAGNTGTSWTFFTQQVNSLVQTIIVFAASAFFLLQNALQPPTSIHANRMPSIPRSLRVCCQKLARWSRQSFRTWQCALHLVEVTAGSAAEAVVEVAMVSLLLVGMEQCPATVIPLQALLGCQRQRHLLRHQSLAMELQVLQPCMQQILVAIVTVAETGTGTAGGALAAVAIAVIGIVQVGAAADQGLEALTTVATPLGAESSV